MNRRSFLKTVGAGVAAALVPTWMIEPARRTVNLQSFCAQPLLDYARIAFYAKWRMDKPFTQDSGKLFTYATDGKICFRVKADDLTLPDTTIRLPPAHGLQWLHDDSRGWKPWPKESYINELDATCIACKGGGGEGHCNECMECDGMGNEWIGAYESARPIKCRACDGAGVRKPHCRACRGKGWGNGPDRQPLGHSEIGAEYDMLIRRECPDAEFVIANVMMQDYRSLHGRRTPHDVVLFRCAAGDGILMAREPKAGA